MVEEHPFQLLFETFGRLTSPHADPVNFRAGEALAEALAVPLEHAGRCVLLKAPRAGHGKTHLLTRMQLRLGTTHEFIPLHAAQGSRIDARTVTDDALRRLVRPLSAAGGLCVLDLVVRRLFSEALQPLVRSGEVPCQDRDGALAALRDRPVETFDFHQPQAVTAQWARENFGVLGPRLALELAQRIGLSPRETGFWVEALFRFASAPLDQPGRAATLVEAALPDSAGEGVLMERLGGLLGMLTLLGRVVLVADELEGFSTDENSALRLAAFIATLRQSVDRLDVVLSLNQDIWETAFLPRLSGGLADRVSEVMIDLDPLGPNEMVALLNSRAPGLGGEVLEHLEIGSMEHHARGLLRSAGVAWVRAAKERQAAAARQDAPREQVQARAAAAPGVAAFEHEQGRAFSDNPPAPFKLVGRVDAIMLEEAGAGFVPEHEPEVATEAACPPPVAARWAVDPGAAAGESLDQAAQPPPASVSPEAGDSVPAAPAGDLQPAEIDLGGDLRSVDPALPAGDSAQELLGNQPESPHGESLEFPPLREPGRVEDLLRQFRERYGRGGL
jgi:hypothetical protein